MTSEKMKYTCRLKNMTITLSTRTYWKYEPHAYYAAPRLYISVKDETIMENLANRKRRPYNVYKTLIHSSMLGQIFDLGKLQWSQYAGCSCPCSPGFILPKQTINMGGHTFSNFDVFVEIEGAPSINESKAPRLALA